MRIRLISTDDPYTRLKAGDEGTVTNKSVDFWGATVLSVAWDCGSTLSLIEGLDSYEEIPVSVWDTSSDKVATNGNS